jgi:acyl carrier protein
VNDQQARDAIEAALRAVAPEVTLDGIDPSSDMRDELDLDSMDVLNLMVGLHERTGVEVPERDYPVVASLEGCITYLVAHADRG